MEYTYAKLECREGIGWLTLTDPDRLNALSKVAIEELNARMDALAEDPEVRVVVVTGAGRAFVAGADIKYMLNMTPAEAARYSKDTTDVYGKIEGMGKVFIAAVNGYALGGGCELALACDMRIASRRAKFGLPETGLGILPGGGGTQRLARQVGLGKAKEMVLTGEVIGAEEAWRLGLVNQVTEPEELLGAAEAMARKVLTRGAMANAYAKEAMTRGMECDLRTGIEYERNAFALCFATGEQREGMAAFVEKRPPRFGL